MIQDKRMTDLHIAQFRIEYIKTPTQHGSLFRISKYMYHGGKSSEHHLRKMAFESKNGSYYNYVTTTLPFNNFNAITVSLM